MGSSLSSITFTSSDADSVETVITIGGRQRETNLTEKITQNSSCMKLENKVKLM